MPNYKLYPGPVRPRNELAVIEFGPLTRVCVDGMEVALAEWQSIELAPGQHFVGCDLPPEGLPHPRTLFEPRPAADSAPIPASPGVRGTWVELNAGRVYRWNRYRDLARTPSEFVWLQDLASGLVVAGEVP